MVTSANYKKRYQNYRMRAVYNYLTHFVQTYQLKVNHWNTRQKKVRNSFKAENKDTWTTSMTYSKTFSGVSIVELNRCLLCMTRLDKLRKASDFSWTRFLSLNTLQESKNKWCKSCSSAMVPFQKKKKKKNKSENWQKRLSNFNPFCVKPHSMFRTWVKVYTLY